MTFEQFIDEKAEQCRQRLKAEDTPQKVFAAYWERMKPEGMKGQSDVHS